MLGEREVEAEVVPLFLGVESDSDTGKRFSERRAQIFLEKYVPKLRPTRGAHELVQRLRREGLTLVIATSANPSELEPMLEQVGLKDLMERKTSADDADHSKPDPDIVQAALKKGALSPESAVMLGDTPYDVEAALSANVQCVALLSGGWNAEALRGASAIYEDPADLLRSFTSSPFSCAALNPGRRDTTR